MTPNDLYDVLKPEHYDTIRQCRALLSKGLMLCDACDRAGLDMAGQRAHLKMVEGVTASLLKDFYPPNFADGP